MRFMGRAQYHISGRPEDKSPMGHNLQSDSNVSRRARLCAELEKEFKFLDRERGHKSAGSEEMALRNEGTAKSVRKALRDVHNTKNSESRTQGKSSVASRFSVPAKKEIPKMEEDDSLDSLLLVQSDLSSVLNQIDKLVARAFEVKTTSKQGRSEIQSFKQVLSDMLSSLKPWVSRFEKALADDPLGHENESVESPSSKSIGSPDETKLESLISPSPLVSWRADCTIKRGRQLFVLTPMPMAKGLLSSRHQESSKSVFERVSCDTTVQLPSLFDISGDSDDDLLEDVVANPLPRTASDVVVAETRSSEEDLPSPAVLSKRENSLLVMTPRLKMSPPKSCVVLEPISESCHQDNIRARKSTPFHARTLDCDDSDSSESSSKEASERLALKYPELLGIQQGYKMGIKKKALDDSWDWFMSPPKSCVLMEPPEENPLKADLHQQTKLPSLKETDVWNNCHQAQKSCHQGFAVESTPMWKQPESTVRKGKPAGENTLKKELWTRFEAATTNKHGFDSSVLPNTAQKGFLDLLEEVSCAETSPVSECLR